MTSKTKKQATAAKPEPQESKIWHIKTKDGQRFVRLGMQFDGQFQSVDVGKWSAEDREILSGESALEIKKEC